MNTSPVPRDQEALSTRSLRVGQAQAIFDSIRVDYPPQTSAMAALDEIRIAGLSRKSGSRCGGAMLVAPHGAGKTEAITQLIEVVSGTEHNEITKILHVEMSTSGTTDSLPTSILSALGATRPDAGSEKIRWPRAVSEIKRSGVQLIVFDEFNRAARRPTMSKAIASAIRERIMDAGVAPVAFVGSEDAATVLAQAPELLERLDDEIDLSPMNWSIKSDRDLFTSFVQELDNIMLEKGLIHCITGLARPEVARPLWEASSGRVRRICKIVRHAMSSALRDGRQYIQSDDLIMAVDAYCIVRQFCTQNPFLRGAK